MRSRCRASTGRRTACSPRARVAAAVLSMHRARCGGARRRARWPGTKRSRWKPLAKSVRDIAPAWLALLLLPGMAAAQTLRSYAVTGDAIATSLTGAPGDPARGRALVVARTSTCILCHSGPFPEEKFQGDLAPSLAGSGGRWTEGQLRLRLVDASSLNAATIMPSYYRVDGLDRVGPAWRGKPILSADQIEDLVSYHASLRE